jgi:phosphatidylserine synthase
MNNSEGILVIIMILVSVVCWFASTFKTGIIMYSPLTMIRNGTTKYRIKEKKRKQYNNAVATSLLLNVFVALAFTRNLVTIAIFVVFNMIFIIYCLRYWILLEPKPRN